MHGNQGRLSGMADGDDVWLPISYRLTESSNFLGIEFMHF